MKRLLLISLLLIVSCCCESGRRVYLSAVHKVVRNTADSMLPNLKDGDYAVIDRSFYRNKPIERFDLVVVRDELGRKESNGSDTYYIKRIIGLGGEEVRVNNGRVYIDGKLLREPYSTLADGPEGDFESIRIPTGEYFLLGDNRPKSYDSRYWNKPTVDKSYIYGKVIETWPKESINR